MKRTIQLYNSYLVGITVLDLKNVDSDKSRAGRAYSLYSPRYYIIIQHGNMCAYAEARTHDPQIKSRTPIPQSYRDYSIAKLDNYL